MSNSATRYLGSVAIAVAVTLAAFLSMHLLVDHDGFAVSSPEPVSSIRFTPVELDEQMAKKPRFVKPEREEPEDLPPLPTTETPERITPPQIERPEFARASIGDGLQIGPPGFGKSERATGDVSCRTRIAPQYPREMAIRGVEGQVTVAFTITPAGTVRDVAIVESNPPRAFDLAAARAVARWKCEPRMVNGAAVEQRVTQTIDFNLDES